MTTLTAAACVLAIVSADVPENFLRVESPAWRAWLDEKVNVEWIGIPLKDVLAGEFGTADIMVTDPRVLAIRVKFDASGLSRRQALWQLSRRYRVTLRWNQRSKPRKFLGLLETQRRRRSVGGVTITTMSHVMRADFTEYERLKKAGEIVEQKRVGEEVYFSVVIDRDIPFSNGSSARVSVVERYKTILVANPGGR